MTVRVSAALVSHPDRIRWNDRFLDRAFADPLLSPAAWLEDLFAWSPPPGPVVELASGMSSSPVELAARGRDVTAVDVSDVALRLLAAEADRRGLSGRLRLVHQDLTRWRPPSGSYALVICRYYWDPAVFREACRALAPGGLLLWEAPVRGASEVRAGWSWGPGEPRTLLPEGFTVISEVRVDGGRHTGRRTIARRRP